MQNDLTFAGLRLNKPAKLVLTVLLFLMIFPTAAAAQGTIVRVRPTGNDSAGCGEVANPCKTLQYAVENLPLGSTATIQIAAGTYTFSGTYVENTGRQVVRVVGRNLTLEGGYDANFTSVNPATNVTIIDGQNSRRGITVEPTTFSGIVYDVSLTLSGVTLQNGSAPQDNQSLSSFGGALDAFNGQVSISNVIVQNNTAQGLDSNSTTPGAGSGGGLSFRQATVTLNQVTLSGNTAQGGAGSGSALRGGLGVGGGLFVYQSTITIDNLSASNNTARAGNASGLVGREVTQKTDGLGGGLAIIESTVSGLSNMTVTSNVAQGGEANEGGDGDGGGLFIELTNGIASLSSATFTGNQALGGEPTRLKGGSGLGGGIFATDTQIKLNDVTLQNNISKGNQSTSPTNGGDGAGGAIYLTLVNSNYSASLTGLNVVAENNQVMGGIGSSINGLAFSGAIQIISDISKNATATLSQSRLKNNTIQNGSFSAGGGLGAFNGAVITLSNVEVSGNSVQGNPARQANGQGGGLYLKELTVVVKDQCIIDNNQALAGGASSTLGGTGFGGGIFSTDTQITLKDTSISSNIAQGNTNISPSTGGDAGGGGLYMTLTDINFSSVLTATDVTVNNNRVTAGLGSTKKGSAFGGGIQLNSDRSDQGVTANLSGVTINGNTAEQGDFSGGGGLVADKKSVITLSDMAVNNNTVQGGTSQSGNGEGGGLLLKDVTAVLNQIEVHNNSAIGANGLGRGGGLFVSNAAVAIDGATILKNSATSGPGQVSSGGGMHLEIGTLTGANIIFGSNSTQAGTGGSTAFGGGLNLLAGATATLNHTTWARNTVSNGTFNDGAAVYVTNDGSTITSNYAIVADHTTANDRAAVRALGTVNFDHTLWDGNTNDIWDAVGFNNMQGTNPHTGSPAFVDPLATLPDFRIQSSSAALDQATGSSIATDFEGQSRPNSGGADLGADEYHTLTVAVKNAGAGSLRADWIPAGDLAGVASYQLSYTKPAGANNATEGASPINIGNTRSFTLTGLSISQVYNIAISALDGGSGIVATSNTASGTPTGLSLSLSVTSAGPDQLDLSWNSTGDTANLSQYRVSYTKPAGANNATEGASPINVGNVSGYALTGLTRGETYTVAVEALNASATTLATSNAANGIPNSNLNLSLTVTAINSNSLRANWSSSDSLTGVSGYRLNYTKAAGANNATEGVSPIKVGNILSFVLTGLTISKTYTITVEALNSLDRSLATSNAASEMPTDRANVKVYLPLVIKNN